MLESKIPMSDVCMLEGGGGCYLIHVPTFDAESKSAKIQNSLCPVCVCVGGGGGGGGVT